MSLRDNQVVALAGVSQAALWAHQLATRGRYDLQRVELAVNSILCTDPESVPDVFGGMVGTNLPGIADGMVLLRAQLGGQPMPVSRSEVALTTRYFGQLLRLAARLQKRNKVMQDISESISRARNAARVMGASHDNTVASLAQTYRSTVSKIKPQIMVQGKSQYLQNEDFARCIRVFLLSGVRGGVLWRQCGGRLWQLLLLRHQLLRAARGIPVSAV